MRAALWHAYKHNFLHHLPTILALATNGVALKPLPASAYPGDLLDIVPCRLQSPA